MSNIWTHEARVQRLIDLSDAWADCTKCPLHRERKNTVFGRGSPTADYLFIGEGPGENEDNEGQPWVGPAGDILFEIFYEANLNPEDVFLTNLVECRPPSNRDPNGAEMEACAPRLEETIYIIDPIVIVPVGGVAMKELMKGTWKSIKEKHGKFGRIQLRSRAQQEPLRYFAMPIYHPSYVARQNPIDQKTGKFASGGEYSATVEELKFLKSVVEEFKRIGQIGT